MLWEGCGQMSGSVHRDGLDSCDQAAVANWKEFKKGVEDFQ